MLNGRVTNVDSGATQGQREINRRGTSCEYTSTSSSIKKRVCQSETEISKLPPLPLTLFQHEQCRNRCLDLLVHLVCLEERAAQPGRSVWMTKPNPPPMMCLDLPSPPSRHFIIIRHSITELLTDINYPSLPRGLAYSTMSDTNEPFYLRY